MLAMFGRDAGHTAGVGSPDMTEAERRIACLVKTGKVTQISYTDTAAPRVRVGIGDPDDEEGYIETDWLPIGHGRSNEWNPLKIGESVQVVSEAGDTPNAVVHPVAIHSQDNPAPGDREDLYRKTFANGGLVEYDEAAGSMLLKAPTSITVQVAPTPPSDGSTPPPGSEVLLETDKATAKVGDASSAVIEKDKITIAVGANTSIVIVDGTITIKAGSTVYTLNGSTHAFTGGNVTSDQTVTASTDVVGGGKSLKSHTHSDPQGGNTGPPS
jgi:phage baseplate assembly protein V